MMSVFIELKDDRSEQVQYNHPDYPIYIRQEQLSSYPDYRAPNHWHNDLEFISIISGKMNYNINGEIITLNSGEGVLVNTKQMHYGFSDRCSECSFICILLHPVILCSTQAYEQDFILPVIRNSLSYIHLKADITWQNEILQLVHSIHHTRSSNAFYMKAHSAFAAIWALLYENIPLESSAGTFQNNDLSLIKNMVGFIQKNYTKKVSLAEIAASGSVGQSKCCKLFAGYFHQTPNAYLNQYRLNKSIELLSSTDLNITEIAMSVGFNGASYYTECFRKWTGSPPTEYRKNSTTR